MPLTKQQLLIPRVLCIGGKEGEPNYHFSPVNTGDILTYWRGSYFDKDNNEALSEDVVNSYPNCFKPLPWWERDESELPDLVWQNEDIYRVDKYDLKRGYVWLVPPEFGHSAPVELDTTIPASLSDYQEYQNSKQ